ncbi:MAG: FkbM family methyltransferase [bacterium]|jgi:FkbM family methyltransferase|nr:FkbM family methyltransferase [bacterium]
MGKCVRSLAYLAQRHLLRRPRLSARADEFGLVLRFKTADVMGRHIYKYGVYEEGISRFLLANLTLEPGDCFIDAGANIGWYSLLLARHLPAGVRGLAFEPDPDTFALLEENLRGNGAVAVAAKRLALSDEAGRRTLYRYADKNTGRNSLLPINTHGQVEIEAARLDETIRREGLDPVRIRFLKVDVEGYEPMVLRGMGELLGRVPLILSEYSPRYMRRGGLDPALYLDLLYGAGYEAWTFAEEGLRPVARAALERCTANTNLLWLGAAPLHPPLRRDPRRSA